VRTYWQDLLKGNIVGIIDAYDAIHSEVTGETIDVHERFNKANRNAHCRWRWNHRESIHALTLESKPRP